MVYQLKYDSVHKTFAGEQDVECSKVFFQKTFEPLTWGVHAGRFALLGCACWCAFGACKFFFVEVDLKCCNLSSGETKRKIYT